MPPFINTDIIDGNVVAAEVLENSSSEEDDEIEEVLPEPVTNTHHFDFRRVQTRLRALLKLNAESYSLEKEISRIYRPFQSRATDGWAL